MKLLVDFMEDKISPKDFTDAFYQDTDLQIILEEETEIVKHTQTSSLCHYIFEVNASEVESVLNAKEKIGLFLDKKEIAYSYSDKTEVTYDVFLSALPKWLNVEAEYFASILNNDTLSKAEKKEQIKAQAKKDFRHLKKPPKWLQDYSWPISNGKPLVFVGQLELDIEAFYDKGAVYVFLNTGTGEIETIKQFY